MGTDTSNVAYFEPGELQGKAGLLSAEAARIVAETNRKIAGMRSLPEAMDFLFVSTGPVCPCDRLSLALLDSDGARLVSHWTRATYEPVVLKTGYQADLQGSSLAEVVNSGRLRVIRDLALYLKEHPDSVSTSLLIQEGIRSSMTCPLRVDDRIVGVLFRSSKEPDAFRDAHLAIHSMVAERLSQAVEKTRQIEELNAANTAYREMLAFVSHELKNPLANILLNAEILARGHTGPLGKEQQERVQVILKQGGHLGELIRDYLDLAQLDGMTGLRKVGRLAFEKDVLDPAIGAVEARLAEQGMRLQKNLPSAALEIEGDASLLRIVLTNLLGNAVQYGRKGGTILVGASVERDRLRVAVRNEGAGFRPEDRPGLFLKFSRLPTPEFRSIKGTGVGLYSCWRIINMHGGRIDAESKYGEWAEFRFEIPVRQDLRKDR